MEPFEERCRKHPFQTLTGVCPFCLSHRLRLLCPDCAAVRPCKCSSSSATSSEIPSTSSSSSSFSSSLERPKHQAAGGRVGSVGRISLLIDSEPAFNRSKSARDAPLPHLRSKSRASTLCPEEPSSNPPESRRRWSLWSFLVPEKQKKQTNPVPEKSIAAKLPRSRSVGVSYFADSSHFSNNPIAVAPRKSVGAVAGGGERPKGWGWSFASPIRVFRQNKAVNGRTPLCRG
ncbi:uncharacterized protein LOC116265376 [Nymphaea colorata]|nr:uncharacterized protein LOC116265376 [Nymphaea colorata]